MAQITHALGIEKPAGNVYQALTGIEGLSGWWTEFTTGDAAHEGGHIHFTFRTLTGEPLGEMKFLVKKLVKNTFVSWSCLEGPKEWIGSEIQFELKADGPHTLLKFTHKGWPENTEFIYHCSMKWAVFLMSLKDLLQKGKGQPSPHDIKIDRFN